MVRAKPAVSRDQSEEVKSSVLPVQRWGINQIAVVVVVAVRAP